MKKLILSAVASLLAANLAMAQTAAPTADKKGDERKKFMSECLKADKPADKK